MGNQKIFSYLQVSGIEVLLNEYDDTHLVQNDYKNTFYFNKLFWNYKSNIFIRKTFI